MNRYQTQASATTFLHLFLIKMQGKNCYFCCIQRSAKSHICSKMLFLSAHSFYIPSICLLHWLYGTMPSSCSIILGARGNWLATPQLVASSTQSQREVKKGARLFCIPGTTHSSLSSRVGPWIPQRGGPSCHTTVRCWEVLLWILMILQILSFIVPSTSVCFDDTEWPQKPKHRTTISLSQVASETSQSQRLGLQ